MRLLFIFSLLFYTFLLKVVAEELQTVSDTVGIPEAKITESDIKKIDDEKKYREALGWIIGKQSDMTHLGFTQVELQDVIKGFELACMGKVAPVDLREISEPMHDYLNKKSLAYDEKMKLENAKIANEQKGLNSVFFEDLKLKNKDNPNFKILATGVCCEILSLGKPIFPKEGDSVKVHYTGMLKDGTIFDSSYKGKEPAIFNLKGVIPGFSQGIRQIGETGRARIYIPAEQGYGNQGIPELIPPGSMLIFEVELLEINPAVFDRVGDAAPSLGNNHQ